MSIKHMHDVIVVGGGPGGMMAAGTAASRGLRVLLIEKNDVLGKKLSITGGGRCNITNAEEDIHTFLHHYGDANKFLYAPFAQFGVQDTVEFFNGLGVSTVEEGRKRVFPESQKAPLVTAALVAYLARAGVKILTQVHVISFMVERGQITGIRTSAGDFTARAYVIATGGKSHEDTGSTGDAFAWLKDLGHTVHPSNPNLVPLKVSDTWVKRLSGVTLSDVRVTFSQGVQKITKLGNVLCTHFGFSGPTVLNSAYEVKQLLRAGPVHVSIDLFPHEDVGALRVRLTELLMTESNKTLVNALSVWFPKGVVMGLLDTLPDDVGMLKAHSVTKEMKHALVDRMKALTATVTDTMGYDWAIVSDGGLDLREVDTKTMASKLHANLFVVGDMLHVNRPSGGFSLQLCWTTGWVAGAHVCL